MNDAILVEFSDAVDHLAEPVFLDLKIALEIGLQRRQVAISIVPHNERRRVRI
jgi:hypothetical protein